MKYILFWVLISTLLLVSCREKVVPEASGDIRKFHQELFVADTHSDTPLRLMRGEDISKRTEQGHMDIPRLKEGGVDCQVFAIWTNPKTEAGEKGWKRALKMIDRVETFCTDNQEEVSLCRNIAEVEAANLDDRIAIMLGVEGGQIIDHHLNRLDTLYSKGVRYITITWNYSQDWATAAIDEANNPNMIRKGLTEFGRDVIRRMDSLRMVIDVSHAGEQTFWDIMKTSKNPVIASHSCAYSLAQHFRNLKDDQIKAIAKRDGVVFVNFYSGYLNSDFEQRWDQLAQSLKPQLDSLKQLDFGRDEYRKKRRELFSPYLKNFNPGISRIVDHIKYIADLVGVDYVGIGSDFDGVSVLPQGLNDVTDLPELTDLLLRRGFSQQEVEKIMGGNFKRVFRKVIGQ